MWNKWLLIWVLGGVYLAGTGCQTVNRAVGALPGIEVVQRHTVFGTVIAGPVEAEPGGAARDVLILDPVVKERLVWIRFTDAGLRDVGKLVIGAKVMAFHDGPGGCHEYEMRCIRPTKAAIRASNPHGRFLTTHAAAIALKGLKGCPKTMKHFFGANLGPFLSILAEVPDMCNTVREAGATDLDCASIGSSAEETTDEF